MNCTTREVANFAEQKNRNHYKFLINFPMEATIFDIKKFAVHDGPGIRTTIFFKACSLDCWWCHNPESITPEIETYQSEQKLGDQIFTQTKNIGKKISPAGLWNEVKNDRIFWEQSDGGVTLSGGEPLLQADFATEFLRICTENNIHTTVDTAGNVPLKNIRSVLPYTEFFLYDIKFFSEDLHRKYTGASNQRILKNFEYLIEKQANIVVRIPLIPGINLEKKEMQKIANYLSNHKNKNFNRIELMPYHKTGIAKYTRFGKTNRMGDTAEPGKREIAPIQQIFTDYGFVVMPSS